jgi:glucose-1-phosphate cytidylyltransferase
MKVVIFAGGLGTRLSEYTGSIPKPMVPIGGKPIIWHIMNLYAKHGYNEFVIALGYRADIIKSYFANYKSAIDDYSIDLSTGEIKVINGASEDWKITLVDTGELTMTGGRLKRLSALIKDETFLLTYGDGLSDVDITKVIRQHCDSKAMITMTVVHPPARFGEVDIGKGNQVLSFEEKPQLKEGWINGGFFVVEPEFLDFIDGDHQMLEQEPLSRASDSGNLQAYKHDGFWQCMDTKRDLETLERMYEAREKIWSDEFINNTSSAGKITTHD